MTATIPRIRAAIRLLVESGEMTPYAARLIESVLEAEEKNA